MPEDRALEQIKMLYDYTKFHIGIYITLAVAAVAAVSSGEFSYCRPAFLAGLFGMALAGLCGGIVASNLPEAQSLEDFYQKRTGPRRKQIFRGRDWASLEHYAFWAGIVLLLGSFIIPNLGG